MAEGTTRGQSVYKSDTNQVGVLQLLSGIVCEQIKGTPSLCLLLIYIRIYVHTYCSYICTSMYFYTNVLLLYNYKPDNYSYCMYRLLFILETLHNHQGRSPR